MSDKVDVFTPDQLKETLEFIPYQDVIEVITDRDKTYSVKQLRNLIRRFCERKES